MTKSEEKVKKLLHEKWDALVIGSGIGGLSTAAALAKYGWKVAVLEQHYVAGGCTHMFSRKGYSWDVGVHCVGQMGPNEVPGKALNWLSDGRIRFENLGHHYDSLSLPGGFSLQFPDSSAEFKSLLYLHFPNLKKDIDLYFEAIELASDSAKYYFISRILPKYLDPLVKRLGKKWMDRTTAEVLDELTQDDRLKTVLASQWGYYGATPKESSFVVHALTIRHFWNGGYYPVGGASTFARELIPTIEKVGGAVFTRTSVKQIWIEKKKVLGVELSGGEKISSSVVFSAVGARATVSRLMGDGTDLQLTGDSHSKMQKTPRERWSKEILSLEQSRAYVTLYLGFSGDIRKWGATRPNQWHFRSWDMEKSEWDVLDPQSQAPFLYLSFPSLKDPSHIGDHHTAEVVTFVPWDAFQKWENSRRGFREKEYTLFKKQLEDRIFKQISEIHPELMSHVDFKELSTPLSTDFFIRAPRGAIYGLQPTPRRLQSRQLRVDTPIDGLYLSGCDVATLGIAGALTGGLLAAGKLEKRVLQYLI